MNLIISAPHGGRLKPDSIPVRQPGCEVDGQCRFTGEPNCPTDDVCQEVATSSDTYTDTIAKGVVDHIFNFTGRRPHLIINRLHRSRLDPNREVDEAAQGKRDAVTAYNEYHAFIHKAKEAIATGQLLREVTTRETSKMKVSVS